MWGKFPEEKPFGVATVGNFAKWMPNQHCQSSEDTALPTAHCHKYANKHTSLSVHNKWKEIFKSTIPSKDCKMKYLCTAVKVKVYFHLIAKH